MRINKNKAVELNIKDLFFQLLYRWRSILIAALIGALLLCGYQYLTIKSTHDAGKQTKEERQYQLDLQDYQDDLENCQNTIRVNTKILQGINKYRKESIYFQLDSQAVWTASNKYLIKVDQSVLESLPQGSTLDPVDGILSVYTSPLSGATDEELNEVFGSDTPEYVSELIDSSANANTNTVTIAVKGASKENVMNGIAFLNSRIEALAAGKAQEIDKHTVSLVSEDVYLGADDKLAAKQNELALSITENQEALKDARKTLDDLQASGEPTAPSMHLPKMAVLGFILGAALMLLLYAALYIFKGKLNNANEMTERYGVVLFGDLPKAGSLHGCRGLDKLLAKWELGKDILSADQIYDNIAALLAGNASQETILLLSSLPEARIASVGEALKERLPDKTIGMKADMLRHSDTIGEAASADVVILVEERHLSRVKDIDMMAEALIISKADVIGSIVL